MVLILINMEKEQRESKEKLMKNLDPRTQVEVEAEVSTQVSHPEALKVRVEEVPGKQVKVKTTTPHLPGKPKLLGHPTPPGELRAVIELFDYLLYHSCLARGDTVVVHTDSQYVLSLLQGSSLPTTHPQLVSLAQQYYTDCPTQFRLFVQRVPGHHAVPGNEIADRLAKRGVNSSGTIGRFSTTPSRPLQPPDIGFNSHSWKEFSVEGQDKFIVSQLTDNLGLIPHLPLAAKKPWISEDTLQLIADFQSRQFTEMDDLKRARKIIKKSAHKDKKLVISRHVELQLCIIPRANLYPRRPEQLLLRTIWRTRSGIRTSIPRFPLPPVLLLS